MEVTSSVLDTVIGVIRGAINSEITLQQGLRVDLAFIKQELEMIQAFLNDANGMRGRSEVAKTWVKQVSDVAYDIEYSLNHFDVRLARSFVGRLLCLLPARHDLGTEIKELKSRVEDVSLRNTRYNQLIVESAGNAQAAFVGSGMLCKKKVNLLDLVNKGNKYLQVIAVCCASGGDSGKSSIIREAYEHHLTHARFTRLAWIKMTIPFNTNTLIQNMAMQFEANDSSQQRRPHEDHVTKMASGDWAEDFANYLQDKYLIVIDGLSSIGDWDIIRTLLPNKWNGSRIIVSTDEPEVASLCVRSPYKVSEINYEKYYRLIYLFFSEEYGFVDDSNFGQTVSVETISGWLSSDDKSKNLDLVRMRMQDDAPKLFGREMEVQRLRHLLIPSDGNYFFEGSDENYRVICLCGPHGVGKTALALAVQQLPEITELFDTRAFVRVNHSMGTRDFLRCLIDKISKDNGGEGTSTLMCTDFDELIHRLRDLLCYRRFLIVIDSLVSIQQWDPIEQVLHGVGNRSCIIVTTTALSIAQHCSVKGKGNIIEIGALTDGDAFSLFQSKVEFEIMTSADGELLTEVKHILQLCRGIPYSITAMGYFLSTKPRVAAEWRQLIDHLSTLEYVNSKEFPSLSYDALTYQQRTCFLYLSIFPEEYNIRRGCLVRRWIAEGYSKDMPPTVTAMQVAEQYIVELDSRGMILKSTTIAADGLSINYKCKVSRDIHKSALKKSMEENFVLALDDTSCSFPNKWTVRHLTVRSNWKRSKNELVSIVDLSRLQSLTVFGEWKPFFLSAKMRSLVVLDLEGTLGLQDKDLEMIGVLIHLKYLSLRGCDTISRLPSSVGHLRHLQTLDVKYTRVTKLPRSIVKLESLQYLRLRVGSRHRDGFRDFRTGVRVPVGLRLLNSLQSLGVVHVNISCINDLKDLIGLRKLEVDIAGFTMTKMQEVLESVANLNRLQSFSIWSTHFGTSMSSPLQRLEKLKLHVHELVDLPRLIGVLRNLKKLTLWNTTLQEEDIYTLGRLHNLVALHLCECSYQTSLICFGPNSFPSLTNLQISFKRISSPLEFQQGALPNLSNLELLAQDRLEETVEINGIKHIQKLEHILLWGCNDETRDNVEAQLPESPTHRPHVEAKFLAGESSPRRHSREWSP